MRFIKPNMVRLYKEMKDSNELYANGLKPSSGAHYVALINGFNP
ncbi:hypothetical protein [uncultured Shewanella sp.]|nr:hypothetical protein [uncultured Shewanella sp.]